jgi:hypothetical protein
MSARRSLVLHAHYYQPPRADPWIGEIPRERSAAPYHDWNERILHECYGPLGAARIVDDAGRITALVNTYEYLSFDVGSTLLEWLDTAAPNTYAAILDGDAASLARTGHGNAIAAPYHHTILPLAARRDKVTEVRWGIDDFHMRFGRAPEGMWLPETAVDDETLDVLAAEGIGFTILAPHQVRGLPADAGAGVYTTRAGRTIAILVYDGAASHAVAFGNALSDATAWADDLGARPHPLTLLATDGETYGHHHTFGEMAVASLIHRVGTLDEVEFENGGAYLARQPDLPPIGIVENTSWSCHHGVERWRAACGCRAHPDRQSQQAWRPVLRDALEWLAGELHTAYARDAAAFFDDPWAARDALGWIACRSEVDPHLATWTTASSDDERARARELLELERNALRMFTSCAWFFDDVAGLEGRQALQTAARAIELTGNDAVRIEAEFLDRLRPAVSNDAAAGHADAVYRVEKPRVPMPVLLAAAAALAHDAGVPDDEVVPSGVAVTRDPDGDISVTGSCGGRPRTVRATVEHGAHPSASVTDPTSDDPPLSITLRDLPDRARARLERHWRGVIAARRLPPDALDRLQDGTPLAAVTSDALHDTARWLEQHAGPDEVEAMLDLIQLAELQDLAVPYDVLNSLVRLCGTAEPRPAELGPLADRLGIA